jgi:hypothetical protein
MRPFSRPCVLLSLASLLLITGCAMQSGTALPSGAASGAFAGKVFGGQQPVKGSTVSVWAAGTGGYGSAATLLATTPSDSSGNFQFAANAYSCPTSTTPIYVTAQGGDAGAGSNSNILLAAGLGSCGTARTEAVQVNEVTTVATAYAMSSFFGPGFGPGLTDTFGSPADQVSALATANGSTIPMLVNLAQGTVNPNTSTITLESAKLYTLADILATCVNSNGSGTACTTLFNDVGGYYGTQPADTLQAAVAIASEPYYKVGTLFQLVAGTAAPFPALATAPNDWTLGVSYYAPNLGLTVQGGAGYGTSTNIDIDANGNVWFPTNITGATGVASFSPATNTFSGPYLTGLVQPQYVSIDQGGYLFASDLSGTKIGYLNTNSPTTNGLLSIGYPTQAIATGFDNTLYFGINAGGPYLASIDPTRTYLNEVGEFDFPVTGLSPAYTGTPGTTYVLSSGSGVNTVCEVGYDQIETGTTYYGSFAQTASTCQSGGSAASSGAYDVISSASTANQICSANDGCFVPPVPVSLPQGIATDGLGYEWIANAGNGSVSIMNGSDNTGGGNDYTQVSPVAYLHGTGNGGTMTQPYGLAIDGAGNVWVSNVSCTTAPAGCTATGFTLSELIGAAGPTITPLSLQYAGAFAGSYPTVRKGTGAQRGFRMPQGGSRLPAQVVPQQKRTLTPQQ